MINQASLAELAIDLHAQVIRDGGLSYNPVYGTTPDTGYAVSLKGYELKIPLQAFRPRYIEEYIVNHLAQFEIHELYLGAWVHEKLVYLDISRVVISPQHAMELGYENEQIAVFDIEAGVSIPVI